MITPVAAKAGTVLLTVVALGFVGVNYGNRFAHESPLPAPAETTDSHAVEAVKTRIRATVPEAITVWFLEVKHLPQTGKSCGYVDIQTKREGFSGYRPFLMQADGRLRFQPYVGSDELIEFLKEFRETCL